MKSLIMNICTAIFILISCPVFSQLNIVGPDCVIHGAKYQYSFTNTEPWDSSATMQVCVTGGIIADESNNSLGTCSEPGSPLGSALIIWNDTSVASVTVTSSAGNKNLNINITRELDAGIIDPSVSNQIIADTASIPSTILCSSVRGGSCSPVYSYQWQQSEDMLIWVDVGGSVSKDFLFTTPILKPMHYRRKVIETGSGTVGYSDIATVNIELN